MRDVTPTAAAPDERRIVHPRPPSIKICGLRRLEDVAAVNDALPDFAGFVFAPSRRRVSLDEARILSQELDERIISVGVFVNAPLEECLAAVQGCALDLVQLHGSEDAAYITALKAAAPTPVIKAIGVGADGALLQKIPENADYVLFDAAQPGGGRQFSWAPEVIEKLRNLRREFFLAGGITVANLDAALALRPWCVDVSSGAEREGCKDPELIRELTVRVHQERRNQE